MITTKITVEPHLAQYCYAKYSSDPEGSMPVRFADHLDVYHLVYNLLEKRPVNCQGDVPGGKSPERFNYLGQRSQGIINKKLKLMMRAELHDFIDENKHRFGIDQLQSVHCFMKKYCIDSLSEDALLKDYQRWRDRVRRSSLKRPYKKK